MYSDPDPASFYLYVAEGEGETVGKPLPIAWHSTVRAAKIKKRWVTAQKELKNELQRKLNDDEIRQIGEDLLDSLREPALLGERPLPYALQLVKVDIAYEDPGFSETPHVIAHKTADPVQTP